MSYPKIEPAHMRRLISVLQTAIEPTFDHAVITRIGPGPIVHALVQLGALAVEYADALVELYRTPGLMSDRMSKAHEALMAALCGKDWMINETNHRRPL